MHTLETHNMSKIIKGNKILDNINLKLQSGKTYGLIGKNGSGKSMLIRVLSGLVKATSGTICIDGKELYKEVDSIGKIGVIIENAGLYPDLTGMENLIYLSKINNTISKEDIMKALIRVGLDPNDSRVLKKYSLGMRQKLVIAQAIMEKPDFIFLDEPTNALDEKSVDLLRHIVKEEAQRNAIILIVSHSKEDIELLCDNVYKMSEGKLSELEY